ncbi:MAG TPA: alpha/beta fold hydrolase, partial [Flavisolibacter sp.]|nr:alpha/beta fold hydrolase [Flavisolibacter sp.]
MNPKWKRNIRRTTTTLLLIYIMGGIILYFIQDLLLFHPTPLPQDHQFSFRQPFEEVNVPVDGRTLNMVKFRPHSVRKGIVLFFHGNRHNVEHYSKYPPLFTKNHYEIWMIEYPGFGKSTGKRTEETMYHDALWMYDKAAKEINMDSLIIYGKSIGTGVASFLASQRQSKQLILETPYYSIDALAKHYFPFYPVMPMTRYSFPIYK